MSMTMSATRNSRAATEDYFKLFRAFPLRPIRGAGAYDLAGKVLTRLLGRPGGKLSADERDYLDALVLMVED